VEEFEAELKDLNKVFVKDLTYDQIICWRKYFLTSEEDAGAGLSNDYFNQCRHIFIELYKIAQEGNPRIQNLGQRLKFAKIYTEELILRPPSSSRKLWNCITEGNNNGWTDARRGFDSRLSYTGPAHQRSEAAPQPAYRLKNWEINLPSKIVKGKRIARTVPIFSEARPLFTRLVAEAGPDGEIFHVGEATETLRKACKLAGWNQRSRITICDITLRPAASNRRRT
jgi:hypothetical protein